MLGKENIFRRPKKQKNHQEKSNIDNKGSNQKFRIKKIKLNLQVIIMPL